MGRIWGCCKAGTMGLGAIDGVIFITAVEEAGGVVSDWLGDWRKVGGVEVFMRREVAVEVVSLGRGARVIKGPMMGV